HHGRGNRLRTCPAAPSPQRRARSDHGHDRVRVHHRRRDADAIRRQPPAGAATRVAGRVGGVRRGRVPEVPPGGDRGRPRRGRRHRLPTQMDQDRGEGAGGCRRQRDRPDGRRSRPAPVHARVRHRHRPRRLGGRAGELVHRAGGGQRIPDTALVDRRRGRRRPGIGQRGFHRRVAGRLRRPVRQALVPRARPLHPLRPGGAVPVVPSPRPVRDRGMSERDSGMTTARRRTWVRLAVAVLLVAVLALLPWIGSSFTVFVATRILILGIFAMAFDLVFGFGGMPSLGHAAFYGLGAYVVSLGITRWGWGAGTVLVVAILGAAVLGLVTGMLTLRTRGIYLLLLT